MKKKYIVLIIIVVFYNVVRIITTIQYYYHDTVLSLLSKCAARQCGVITVSVMSGGYARRQSQLSQSVGGGVTS